MHIALIKVVLGTLFLSLLSACGGGGGASFDGAGQRILDSITITPSETTVASGTAQQYLAIGRFTDGSEEDLTSSVTWSNDNEDIASISSNGLAEAGAPGSTLVSATSGNVSSTARLTVTEAVIAEVVILPPVSELKLGTTQDFRAFAIYSDKTLENITFAVDWALKSNSGIIAPYEPVLTRGLSSLDDFATAIGVAAGEDQLVVSFSGLADEANVSVVEAELTSLSIAPRNHTTISGAILQYTATGNFDNGTRTDLTKVVEWTSSDPTVADISNEPGQRGQADAMAAGLTTIAATLDGLTETTKLVVFDDPGVGIDRLEITPAAASIAPGGTQAYRAEIVRENGETIDVTGSADWRSADTNIAEIDDTGVALGLSQGQVEIAATFGGLSAMASLLVVADEITLQSIKVTPANATLLTLTRTAYQAFGLFSDGSQRDLTDSVVWQSEERLVVTMSNDDNFGKGTAFAVAAGSTIVVATQEGITGSTPVTVIPRDVDATLTLSPASADIPVGGVLQYKAELTINGSPSLDVTNDVSWFSENGVIAEIGSDGSAAGISPGTTAIRATLAGGRRILEATARLTVKLLPVVLESIVISPPDATVTIGSTQIYTARAFYSDGSSSDVTNEASWSSDDGSIAEVSEVSTVRGIASGETQVRAFLKVNEISAAGTAGITVISPEMVALHITPPSKETIVGGVVAFTALAELQDGRVLDVTADATWQSGDLTVAAVDNAGIATGLSAGTTGIGAQVVYQDETFVGEALLTVKADAITIDELIVDPAESSIIIGNTRRYSARVLLSDGTYQDVSSKVSWRSSDISIAAVDGNGTAIGLEAGTTNIIANLNHQGQNYTDLGLLTVTGSGISIDKLIVDPPTTTVLVGTTAQFVAYILLSDGSTQDVTTDVDWTTGEGAIAHVDSAGVATGLAEGESDVVAKLEYEGHLFSDAGHLTVAQPAPTVIDLRISPSFASIYINAGQQFLADAILSDGSIVDVSEDVSWTSGSVDIASVDAVGMATGISEGEALITATLEVGDVLIDSSALLEVKSLVATPETLIIEPSGATILTASTQSYLARLLFSDGSQSDVTGSVSWSSLDKNIAAITSDGTALGRREGTTRIQAQINFDGIQLGDAVDLHVLPRNLPELPTLRIDPEFGEILVGTRQQFVAILEFANGLEINVTSSMTWTSSNPMIVVINQSGTVAGISEGTTEIQASFTLVGVEVQVTAVVNVSPPSLENVELIVAPQNAQTLVSGTVAYTATARFTSGRSQDVTNVVRWNTANGDIAIIDKAGVATGIGQGATRVEAELVVSGVTLVDSASLSVKPPAIIVESIDVSPDPSTIKEGERLQFVAIAMLSDGSSQDVSADVAWLTLNDTVASIDSNGLLTGLVKGTTEVEARLPTQNGPVSGLALLNVVEPPPVPVSLEITPAIATIPLGVTQDYRATAFYSDGTTQNVTNSGEWSMFSSPAILERYNDSTELDVNAIDEFGTAIAVLEGNDTILFGYMGLGAEGEVSVTKPVLEGIAISPRNESTAPGDTLQYEAFGNFSDGSSSKITDSVAWQLANEAIASISNTSPDRGVVTAISPGVTQVSAILNGISDETSLRVVASPVLRVDVLPAKKSIRVGEQQQYQALAIREDGGVSDVTGSSSWQGGDPDVAQVSTTGLAVGLAGGQTTIIATFEGTAGSADLAVKENVVLEQILIEPVITDILRFTSSEFTATGYYSDNTSRNITDEVTWTVSDRDILRISNTDRFGKGRAFGLSVGETTVQATYPGEVAVGDAKVTVIPLLAGIDSLEVNPPSASILTGSELSYEAILVLGNERKVDVTQFVRWQSSNTAIASVDGDGVAYGESAGEVIITANINSAPSVKADAALQVKNAVTVDELVVTPPLHSVLEDSSVSYYANALLSDGTNVDVTTDVDWSTGDGAIARIDTSGTATGSSVGRTSVTATLDLNGALVQGTSTIIVLPDIAPTGIIVSPPNAEVLAGTNQQYTAEIQFSDGRKVDITSSATWTTSDSVIAQIAPGGLATGKQAGTVDVVASVNINEQTFSGSSILQVLSAVIEQVQVTPQRSSVLIGDDLGYAATAVLTDGSIIDITRQSNWFSSDSAVVEIQSGFHAGLATALMDGEANIYIEFSQEGVSYPCEGVSLCEAVIIVSAPAIEELQVSPAAANISVGEQQPYTALAILENGDKQDVTTAVTWRSGDTGVVSIDQSGSATGVTAGTVAIGATLNRDGQILEDEAQLEVSPAAVEVLEVIVTPADETVIAGGTLQYKATAFLSDNTSTDVTGQSAWSTNDGSIAHITGEALATGIDEGVTTIEAGLPTSDGVITGATNLRVKSALTIQSIRVSPQRVSVLIDDSQQFMATATLSDLSELDVTRQAIWFTFDPAIAVVAQGRDAGLATAKGEGEVRVWAEVTVDGTAYPCAGVRTCEATLSVNSPVVAESLQVTPVDMTILVDSTEQFTAELSLSDGSVIDVTANVAWRSSDQEVASPQSQSGLFIGLASGTATITASGNYEGVELSDSTSLTIEAEDVTIDRLEVYPPVVERFPGDTGKFIATAYLSNNEAVDVSEETSWRSEDPDVATIDPNTGVAVAVAPGETAVRGQYQYNGVTVEDSSLVTISERTPVLLEIQPNPQYGAAGDSTQFSATLYYEGGVTEPVTESVTWESSDDEVATISNFGGNKGVATAIAAGEATLMANHASGHSATAQYIVTPPVLESLIIDPAVFDLVEGTTSQLTALATFSDESVLVVSTDAQWSSDTTDVLVVGNGASGGEVQGVSPGSAIVTARYLEQTTTATGNVIASVLASGWIEPASNTLQEGDQQGYRAFGSFTDGSNREITSDVDWNSSNPDVAIVSNQNNGLVGASKGQVNALLAGTTEILATLGSTGLDSSLLTVTASTAQSLTISPSSVELRPDETAYFTASAVFSDGSTRDVTNSSVWLMDDTGVAIVENNPGQSSQVRAVAAGNTQLVANLDGLEDTASITVIAVSGECEGKPDSVFIVASQTVPEGQEVQFMATGVYPDGCEQDITDSNQTVWQSQDKKICDFDGPKGGLATGLKEGVGTVEVSHRGEKHEATCTVTAREN